jgi:tetratricopeptide (TPR) repeat protein
MHPRFRELIGRHRSVGGEYFARARADPGYLSDLRAKRHEEPHRFFLESAIALERPALEGLLDRLQALDCCTRELAATVGVADRGLPDFDPDLFFRRGEVDGFTTVAHMLGYYVNVLGSWPDAVALANAITRSAAELPPGRPTARLLEASGQALAIGALDRRARISWRLATDQMPRGFDRFFLLMRIATTEFKRFQDQSRAREAMLLAAEEARLLPVHGHSSADARLAAALVLNLEALVSLTAVDFDQAESQVERGWGMLRELESAELTLEPSVVSRYRLMVLENRALLCVRCERWDRAAALFAEAVEFARSERQESLSEALTLAGYVQLRRECLAVARRTLTEAVGLLSVDSRPSAFESTCRMLALACAHQGDERSAAIWLKRATAHAESAGWGLAG